MNPRYDFSLSPKEDTILTVGGSPLNLGYNYTAILPLMSYVYHRQLTGENLFQNRTFQRVEDERFQEMSLRDLIEDMTAFLPTLPTSQQGFNDGMPSILRSFYGGDNKTVYTWRLTPESQLQLSRQFRGEPESQNILALDQKQNEEFASVYLAFLEQTEVLHVQKNEFYGNFQLIS